MLITELKAKETILSLVSGKSGAGLGYDSQVSGWKR